MASVLHPLGICQLKAFSCMHAKRSATTIASSLRGGSIAIRGWRQCDIMWPAVMLRQLGPRWASCRLNARQEDARSGALQSSNRYFLNQFVEA
jgi:hypothetical protein